MKNLYVVVLAWNHWQDTRECLESLSQSQVESMQIVVVDNGSTDGTGDMLRTHYPDVLVVSLPENRGINRGYNAGMEKALGEGAEYVVIMNNDTWAHPRMLSELVAALERDPRAGVAAPKIVYYDDPSRLWFAGARWSEFPPDVRFIGLDQPDGPGFNEPREIEFATSCCLCIRSRALKDIGLFDPSFMFYYDDWDFGLRLKRGGYRLIYVPQALLKHKISISTRKADPTGKWSRIQGRDSALFFLRNSGMPRLGFLTLWVFARELFQGHVRSAFAYVLGVWQGLAEKGARP